MCVTERLWAFNLLCVKGVCFFLGGGLTLIFLGEFHVELHMMHEQPLDIPRKREKIVFL